MKDELKEAPFHPFAFILHNSSLLSKPFACSVRKRHEAREMYFDLLVLACDLQCHRRTEGF